MAHGQQGWIVWALVLLTVAVASIGAQVFLSSQRIDELTDTLEALGTEAMAETTTDDTEPDRAEAAEPVGWTDTRPRDDRDKMPPDNSEVALIELAIREMGGCGQYRAFSDGIVGQEEKACLQSFLPGATPADVDEILIQDPYRLSIWLQTKVAPDNWRDFLTDPLGPVAAAEEEDGIDTEISLEVRPSATTGLPDQTQQTNLPEPTIATE